MDKLIKWLIGAILIIGITWVVSEVFDIAHQRVMQKQSCERVGEFTACQYTDPYAITAFVTDGVPEYIFRGDNTLSVAEFAKKEGYRFLINAAYFSDFPPHAKPAGYYRVHGKELSKMQYDDPNLSRVISVDADAITQVGNVDYSQNPSSMAQFQAGPILIASGRIDMDAMSKSWHADGKFPRTIFMRNIKSERDIIQKNSYIFLTFREPITLPDATKWIMQNFPISPDTWAINLDGGPSVAVYLDGKEDFQHGSDKVLPSFFGIR